ncbi:hypothetical protein, partial [Myxococcus sp. AB025B]|uniref:hypothetical protein n=1 Tax=Myxococcus sp. AB025B TaxID=2562794 RepID=UPI001E3E13E4
WQSPCRTGFAELARSTLSRFLGASRPDLIGRTQQRPDWPSLDKKKVLAGAAALLVVARRAG